MAGGDRAAAATVLTLFPAGSIGPALGPPLALRLDGLYHPRAALTVVAGDEGSSTRLAISRYRAADGASRTLEVGETPIVATLPAGRDPGRRGRPAREVEMLPFHSEPRAALFRELSSETDELERVEMVTTLVTLGRGRRPPRARRYALPRRKTRWWSARASACPR